MPSVQVTELAATSPELSDAAILFNSYRCFYGCRSDIELCRRYLVERLEAGESTVFLARRQGRWIGLCQLYRGFSSIACARTVVLNDLYVDRAHRHAGVGRALIEKAREFARRIGAARVTLETAEDNVRAQAIYASLGFERSTSFVGYSWVVHPG